MRTPRTNLAWRRFFQRFAGVPRRALLLDYDGTLAPFRVQRDQAVLHPELRDRLAEILRTGRTRVAVISGRALADLVPLLGLDPLPELWGCHGWERRLPDGQYLGPELDPEVRDALEQAGQWARSEQLDGRCEPKPASIALHWRGISAKSIERLRERVRTAWEPLADNHHLELHEFDGGLELRATGRDKGYAVAQILRELEDGTLVAYAGDDRTDEDAFQALSGRGLSILVGSEYRPTAADLWLQPHELARFLAAWVVADREGG